MGAKPNNELGINDDHVGGYFEWDVEPECKCGLLKGAVEEGFVFVSNITSGGFNSFYMMPLITDGSPARDDGVAISHCPWCGDQIQGRKRYPTA